MPNICKSCKLLAFFFAAGLYGQTLKPGMEAPPITAKPLDASQPFAGWAAYRGNFVVVDFWATWCGSCLPGLNKFAALEKEFADSPIRFLTVASDERDRVKKYFSEKGLKLQTFIDGEEGKTAPSFGVRTIPGIAVIDREGRIVGVTSGENVTGEVIRKLLAGDKIELPAFQRSNNIYWDREEITWQDGVQPIFQVLIKPMEVAGGGVAYRHGSNRISGDGASVNNMIQAAWQTDSIHLDLRLTLTAGTYRFSAMVPRGREADLLPVFQDALQRTFAFQARWEEPEREVLVLRYEGTAPLKESSQEPYFGFMRGRITMKKQSTAKLAEALPNWVRKVVVDETGLSGLYDFDLEYRAGEAQTLIDGLRQKYGLVLVPARRPTKILLVEPKS